MSSCEKFMIISQSDVICQDNRDAHFSENINFTKKIVFFLFSRQVKCEIFVWMGFISQMIIKLKTHIYL